MESKGFLVLAQNTEKHNYVLQAVALAKSIKATQSITSKISLVTNDEVPEEFRSDFDQIISIPWEESTEPTRFRSENRWKLYHISPYHETIVLDSDMLILKDLKHWWKYLEPRDLHFCTKIVDFRGNVIPDEENPYRKTFLENELPSVYFGLHYFKKSTTALTFYKLLEFVINNWQWAYGKFASESYQNYLSMDLSAAIVLKILLADEEAVDVNSLLKIIHMKPKILKIQPEPLTWINSIPHYFKNKELYVGNFKQQEVFHYIDKDIDVKKFIEVFSNE